MSSEFGDNRGKVNLLGMTLSQLQQLCADEGFPKFTAKQLCDWLYRHRADSIDRMTNLSLAQRARLQEIAFVGRTHPVNCQLSKDGTKKYLFPVRNSELGVQRYIEAVYIPETNNSELHSPNSALRTPNSALRGKPRELAERTPNSELSRATLCVSCQAGCRMNCRFCSTGAGGFHGNLSAGDIVNQLFSIPEFESLTNVVFMGMGEPMDNLDAVLDACQVLTAPWGLGWSPKRITVSTMGLIPGMRRFIEECQCHLAVSLHNPVPAERERLMPVQRAYPLADVLALLRKYDWSGQRRLSFEYTMFRGLNDDLAHAQRLLEALKGLECHVNLIRFHENGAEIPAADGGKPLKLATSSPSAIAAFESHINRHGGGKIVCTVRTSRGQDIDAACGLLAGKNTR